MSRIDDTGERGTSGARSADTDASLRAVGGLDWPGPERNERIEEFLMQQASGDRSAGAVRRRLGVRLGVWLGLGAVVLSGVVYGSARLYQRYFVHLTVNGKEQYHEVEAGADGTALISVPMEGGGKARILVGPENIGKDGVIHAGIEVHKDGEVVKDPPTKVEGPVREPSKTGGAPSAEQPKPAAPEKKPNEKPAEKPRDESAPK